MGSLGSRYTSLFSQNFSGCLQLYNKSDQWSKDATKRSNIQYLLIAVSKLPAAGQGLQVTNNVLVICQLNPRLPDPSKTKIDIFPV